MGAIAVAFVFSFLFYLLLTAGSGSIVFWSAEELFAGILLSAAAALLAKKLFSAAGIKPSFALLNPKRILLFFIYCVGPLFFEMAKANLDVAYRVITGKIRPGIVRISPGLRSDFGLVMLANGITLTPGTLSVDIDKQRNLYVHWIYVKSMEPKIEEVCSSFCKWARRLTE